MARLYALVCGFFRTLAERFGLAAKLRKTPHTCALYADEDFDRTVVDELRRLGHDVHTVQEDGCGGRSVQDDGVLALAKHVRRAVLTFNRIDFIRLHNQSAEHNGIIVCTRDPDAIALATRIHEKIGSYASLDGQLVRVNRLP